MTFRDDQTRKLRLALLRLLVEAGDEGANSFVLTVALAELGHRETRDRVRGELDWLSSNRLAALLETGGPPIASVTERGADVARGLAQYPGVELYVPGA